MSDLILSSNDGKVGRITINRADRKNMLSLAMLADISKGLAAAAAAGCGVVVLDSRGDVFCGGRDTEGSPPMSDAVTVRDQLAKPILDFYDTLAAGPVIICRVQGPAVGLGCALATACDITIASDKATFRLPEMMGDLPPTLAVTAMASRVPHKALAHMVLAMPEHDAQRALALGLASEVVAANALDARVDELVGELRKKSRNTVMAVKEYVRAVRNLNSVDASNYAANLMSTVIASAKR